MESAFCRIFSGWRRATRTTGTSDERGATWRRATSKGRRDGLLAPRASLLTKLPLTRRPSPALAEPDFPHGFAPTDPRSYIPWRGFCIRAASAEGAPMSTLIVIPARLGATRLPRKPLRLLGGEPLIIRVWERVSAMNIADRVVVATDSPEVADAARSAGAQGARTRDDHPSGTDRVAEGASSPQFTGYDAFVNVQGDEPFIGADAVSGALSQVPSGRFPLGTAACRAGSEVLTNPDVVKVVTDTHGRAP